MDKNLILRCLSDHKSFNGNVEELVSRQMGLNFPENNLAIAMNFINSHPDFVLVDVKGGVGDSFVEVESVTGVEKNREGSVIEIDPMPVVSCVRCSNISETPYKPEFMNPIFYCNSTEDVFYELKWDFELHLDGKSAKQTWESMNESQQTEYRYKHTMLRKRLDYIYSFKDLVIPKFRRYYEDLLEGNYLDVYNGVAFDDLYVSSFEDEGFRDGRKSIFTLDFLYFALVVAAPKRNEDFQFDTVPVICFRGTVDIEGNRQIVAIPKSLLG